MSLATAVVSLGIVAGPASAQQSGLINVVVSDNTVQVPIAVAANVCGLQVGVLAQELRQGPVDCSSSATSTAIATRDNGGGGGGGPQSGLVNLAITNNTVQVPIGIAANICGVQAGILAQDLRQGKADCLAEGDPRAEA
jgi:hypothetical protein